MEPNSVDACVTDPPYELGFMGKKWDSSGVAFDPETWRAVYRVLKPGAHLLAFGGTRTVHRIAVAIEDAGFDIRDQLSWLYGSGFPKSLDVSKAIDAHNGDERPIAGENPRAAQQTPKRGTSALGNFDGAPPVLTSAASAASAAWAGWGTALKPACEPIVLARKPLIGTVAANVLAHGTGGINVDGCRIEGEKRSPGFADSLGEEKRRERTMSGGAMARQNGDSLGRWPANVLLDEEAAAMLDEQSGVRQSGTKSHRIDIQGADGTKTYGAGVGTRMGDVYGDTGGASRFFYVAKASRRERDTGCEHLPPKSAGEATDREEDTDGLNSPRAGAGRTGGARNFHPTVKPVQLMRYLVRLVTPPGGVVLDPFTGSGTTGVAAMADGFQFIGIEREAEYATIAEARIVNACAQTSLYTEDK